MTYTSAVEFTFDCATPGVTVHYVVSAPGASDSSEGPGPGKPNDILAAPGDTIRWSSLGTVTVRAVADRDGMIESSEVSATFTVVEPLYDTFPLPTFAAKVYAKHRQPGRRSRRRRRRLKDDQELEGKDKVKDKNGDGVKVKDKDSTAAASSNNGDSSSSSSSSSGGSSYSRSSAGVAAADAREHLLVDPTDGAFWEEDPVTPGLRLRHFVRATTAEYTLQRTSDKSVAALCVRQRRRGVRGGRRGTSRRMISKC